jgi:hypothetical protein
VARIGWFPENLKAGQHCETCCTADMVALAIRLSDAGAGDCWDDADRFTRNQLVEQQIIRADYLQRLSDASQAKPVDAPRETADHVIERNIGGFAGHGDLSELPDTWIMHCCTGNGANALYYAWEGALRVVAGTATVNLLLNRASQDLDVHSHLPYEGRVELRNKSARRVLVRVPPGVERGHVECRIGARRVEPVVVGRYVLVDGMKGGEHVEVRFPLAEHRERLVLEGREHSAVMRGNTMVSISPRASGIGYPIYERDFLCDGRAPVRHASPYVPRRVLAWV